MSLKPIPVSVVLLALSLACSKGSDSDFFDEPIAQGGQGGLPAAGGQQPLPGDPGVQGGAGKEGASAGTGGTPPSNAGAASEAGSGGEPATGAGGSGGASGSIECADELRFEGRCYRAGDGELDWASAKAACEALGAHLVTIASDEENEFVWSIIEDELWLGATDGRSPTDDEPGTYTWVTGEAMTYENWTEGQPNAVGTDCPGDDECYEHCAFLWQGGDWNDRYCGHEIPFVCEWD